MASDTFRNVTIGFILFGLVTVLLVTAIQEMSSNYGVSGDRLQEATAGSLDIDEYEAELGNVDQDTENFRQRFESGEVNDVDDPSGVFNVAGDIVGVITKPFNLLAQVGKNVLGIPEIVTISIVGILNIVLLAGLWRLIRAGD